MSSRLSRVMFRIVVAAVFVFLWLPIVVIFVVSFDTSTFMRFPPQDFGVSSYGEVFASSEFMDGLIVSLVVSAITTVLTLAIAVTAALVLARQTFRGANAVQAYLMSPLMVPNIILGLAILLLFSPLGLTDNYPGLVLAHAVVVLPYALRTVLVSLATADASAEDAARVLGATRWRTFWRVTLPSIRPGLLAAGALAFLVSFDEAVISLFLSGFSVRTLPVVLLDHMETQAGPEVAALSVLLILFSFGIMLVVERVAGLARSVRI